MMGVELVSPGVFDVKVGGMTIRMDSTGKDAVSPSGMFLASLAACMGVYADEYCRNAGIKAEGLRVELDYERLQNPGRFGNMKAKIIFPKNTDLKDREKAIIKAAEQCLVHESMKGFKGVEITLEK